MEKTEMKQLDGICEEFEGGYEVAVMIDLSNAISKKAHAIADDVKYDYIVVEHPHQRPAKIYKYNGCTQYLDSNIDRACEQATNKELSETLNDLDAETVIDWACDLHDLNSYEIYKISELPSLPWQRARKIFKGQGGHNRVYEKTIIEVCY